LTNKTGGKAFLKEVVPKNDAICGLRRMVIARRLEPASVPHLIFALEKISKFMHG
jgi:hypothetical protein